MLVFVAHCHDCIVGSFNIWGAGGYLMIAVSSYIDEILHCLWLALRSMASVVLSGVVVSRFGFVLGVVFPETVELVDALIEFK